MISSWILWLLYKFIYLITLPLALLPDVSLPADITNAIAQASSVLAIIDVAVPVSTIVTIIILMVSIEAGFFLYKTIRWLYSKIPGIN